MHEKGWCFFIENYILICLMRAYTSKVMNKGKDGEDTETLPIVII